MTVVDAQLVQKNALLVLQVKLKTVTVLENAGQKHGLVMDSVMVQLNNMVQIYVASI